MKNYHTFQSEYLHDNQISFKGIFHDKLSQTQMPICLITHSQQLSLCNSPCTKIVKRPVSNSYFKMKGHLQWSRLTGYSFIHSIGMCRMRWFLAVLRNFFHSSVLCSSPATLPHKLFFHPLSPHPAIYFWVCLSVLLFPNSYIIPVREFFFLPLSVHAQTNVIYLTLLSLL